MRPFGVGNPLACLRSGHGYVGLVSSLFSLRRRPARPMHAAVWIVAGAANGMSPVTRILPEPSPPAIAQAAPAAPLRLVSNLRLACDRLQPTHVRFSPPGPAPLYGFPTLAFSHHPTVVPSNPAFGRGFAFPGFLASFSAACSRTCCGAFAQHLSQCGIIQFARRGRPGAPQ